MITNAGWQHIHHEPDSQPVTERTFRAPRCRCVTCGGPAEPCNDDDAHRLDASSDAAQAELAAWREILDRARARR